MNCKKLFPRAMLFAIALVPLTAAALQTDIAGPPGSVNFGAAIHTLPNGNLLIVDPEHGDENEGAIHLYAPDGTRISTLTGTRSGDIEGPLVTILKNGNAVVTNFTWDNGPVTDAGAVTFIDANTGRNGAISAQNSLVGTRERDHVGRVVALPAGGYVVQSDYVDVEREGSVIADIGAWTFGRGDVGVKGTISAANSVLGSTSGDFFLADAVVLSDGHVALRMPFWDHGSAQDAGAVYWMNGVTGSTGVVSAANAFVGAKADDRIGSLVTALTQGHYAIGSPSYDDGALADVGAVTWRRGGAPHPGVMTGAESLLGSSAQDYVGFHALLPNGRMLVISPYWHDGALAEVGAATLVSGTAPTAGRVTAANALTGSHAHDRIGDGGLLALANGKVVLKSPSWNGEAGAATWLDPAAGLAGQTISEANSLIGTVAGDKVGVHVAALANGHYVVGCPNCDRGGVSNAGAIVWCNGASGRSGIVSIDNAMTGSNTDDYVGSAIIPLPNGNFVATSYAWDDGAQSVPDAGAVTWFDGDNGIPYGGSSPTGEIDRWNSLVGSSPGDRISDGYGAIVLASGDYLVRSPSWDRDFVKLDAGAVTWVDGDTGLAGPVTPENSLVGSRRDDEVGGGCGALALPNGSFVISSCLWNQPGSTSVFARAGAVTWARGDAPLTGEITPANSLMAPEGFGDLTGEIVVLPNGDYVVRSKRLDVMVGGVRRTDAGGITLGRADGGTVGTIGPHNSVLGTLSSYGDTLVFAYSPRRDQLVVGRPMENVVSFFDERLMRDGFE